MDKPIHTKGFCDICQNEIVFIQDRNPPNYKWDKVTVKYESAWNIDDVEESIMVDYQLCYECFFYKVIPKLYKMGLQAKKWITTGPLDEFLKNECFTN